MRVCDLLRHFNGNMMVNIIDKNKETVRSNTLSAIHDECINSFNPLAGFNNPLWESNYDAWYVIDNELTIVLNRKEN